MSRSNVLIRSILLFAVISFVGCSPSFPPLRPGDSGCANVSGRYLLASATRLDEATGPPKYPRCKFLDILFDHGMSESASCLLPALMEIRQQGCAKIEYWWIGDSTVKGGEVAIAEATSRWLQLDVKDGRRDWCVATFTSCRKTSARIRVGAAKTGALVLWAQVFAEDGWFSDFLYEEAYMFAPVKENNPVIDNK